MPLDGQGLTVRKLFAVLDVVQSTVIAIGQESVAAGSVGKVQIALNVPVCRDVRMVHATAPSSVTVNPVGLGCSASDVSSDVSAGDNWVITTNHLFIYPDSKLIFVHIAICKKECHPTRGFCDKPDTCS